MKPAYMTEDVANSSFLDIKYYSANSLGKKSIQQERQIRLYEVKVNRKDILILYIDRYKGT